MKKSELFLKGISLLIVLLSVQLIFTSCETEEISVSKTPSIISETTQNNNEATFTSLKISGKITLEGGSEITSRGVCWSTNPNPTINDNKVNETSNSFSSTITNLTANTKYYFRVFAINSYGVSYDTEQTFNTLTLDNTTWKFSTLYPPSSNSTGYTIYSRVDFYDNSTTRFDELDFPLHCPGCFITDGTWSLNGNTVTYYWDSTDPSNPVYVYTGILSGMSMNGSFTHASTPGTWNAIPL
ncbi:MAG: fibronectin type III domain-containing protein [Flavobacterium sp.]